VSTATISINFNLPPVETAAADKVASMMQDSDASELELMQLCAGRLSPAELDRVKQTLSFARSLKSTNASHPSMRAYFSHPVRVARTAFQLLDQPLVEIVSLGLVHNVFEVTGLTEADLIAAGFSSRLAGGIRLTTINRELQYDASYLKGFYRRIQEFGEDLALIKCVDKLDNLLAFELFERTPQIEQYLALSEEFVVPLAAGLSSDFGAYVQRTIDYMRLAGCNQSLRTRYQHFLSAAGKLR
jgi:(p)ppGpp synthase/HD superfamily hydrolase